MTVGRVLVIDDNTTNLAVLGEMLEARGYEVAVANSGRMGLDIAARQRPEVILLDLIMPEIDGYEICRRLQQLPELSTTPVLFLTGDTNASSRAKGYQAGAADYLAKPFQADELLSRLDTHISLFRLRNRFAAEVEQRLAARSAAQQDILRQLHHCLQQLATAPGLPADATALLAHADQLLAQLPPVGTPTGTSPPSSTSTLTGTSAGGAAS